MRRNWPLWIGLILAPVAFLSYFLVFSRYPSTRDVPWVNFILMGIAVILLIAGVRRAFATPSTARRVIASIVTVVGLGIAALFLLSIFVIPRRLPVSGGAPAVGQKAPDFTLPDVDGRPVSLSDLRTASPKGVVLIFYRGYW